MSDILSIVENEIQKITHIIDQICKSTIKPHKIYFVSKMRSGISYYYSLKTHEGKQQRRYLGRDASEKFKSAFSSAYNAVMLEILEKDLKLLRAFKDRFQNYSPEAIKAKMSPCVRMLNAPSFIIDKTNELIMWATADYPVNTKKFGKQKIYAKDGRRVRSKSECIIYNMLLDAGIPFRYDSLVKFMDPMGDICNKAPDFLFKCLDGSYIILEHAGMLSDSDYCADFADRIRIYSANGYEMNVNLFVTSDYGDGGINSAAVEKVIGMIKQRVFQY